jgi:hypothetical protein
METCVVLPRLVCLKCLCLKKYEIERSRTWSHATNLDPKLFTAATVPAWSLDTLMLAHGTGGKLSQLSIVVIGFAAAGADGGKGGEPKSWTL